MGIVFSTWDAAASRISDLGGSFIMGSGRSERRLNLWLWWWVDPGQQLSRPGSAKVRKLRLRQR